MNDDTREQILRELQILVPQLNFSPARELRYGQPGLGGEIPVGGIILWSGSVATIPDTWQLCDGTNGTPDLRGSFIIGGGGGYAVGATGGSADQPNHTGSLFHNQDGPYTHTGGAHTHMMTSGQLFTTNFPSGFGTNSVDQENSGQGHSHPQHAAHDHGSHSLTSISHGTNLPPYYALAYIMRVS